jgi:DNA repair exonuclease SbcCD nuclease subunit
MHLKINKFELAQQFLSWLDATIAAIKPDLVVNLGDTFDTHAVIRSEIMTEFIRHVSKATEICDYVYLLGNHDMFKPNDAKYHALLHLKGLVPRLHIIDEITHGPWGISWVPYQHDPKNFPTKTQSICVAHQTFRGADYGDITVKDGVDSSMVDADTIISGHIHKRQVLGKVIYPGSPFSQSVNDINQIKGVMLYDTESETYEFLESRLPKWRGLRFEVTPSCSIAEITSELEDTLKETKDHWVIELTGPKGEIISFLEAKATKKLFDGVDVKIKTNFTDKEKKLVKIKSVSVDSIMNEYIDKVYSGSLDKNELNLKSLELLEKVHKSKSNK